MILWIILVAVASAYLTVGIVIAVKGYDDYAKKEWGLPMAILVVFVWLPALVAIWWTDRRRNRRLHPADRLRNSTTKSER